MPDSDTRGIIVVGSSWLRRQSSRCGRQSTHVTGAEHHEHGALTGMLLNTASNVRPAQPS